MPSDETNAPRAGLYARVSSDLQSAASIADQLRMCTEWAAKQGWLIAGSYTDQAVFGASMIRPGIQKVLQDAAMDRQVPCTTPPHDRPGAAS
jgi:DNA invertase Pin-like site-specific DNA recombinase